MIITDINVKRELKTVRCSELEESLSSYPDDEVDGRSDMQMLADECGYILSIFEEEGHDYNDSLNRAKEILRETKNGKQMPLYKDTLKPKYREIEIQDARQLVNEYKRLKSLMQRLETKGYYSQWY